MQTVADNLRAEAERIGAGIDELLPQDVRLRDMNTPDSLAVIIGPSHVLPSLSLEQKRVQARLSGELAHFMELVRSLLRARLDEVGRKVDAHEDTLERIIEHHAVWEESTQAVRASAHKALDGLLEQLSYLSDGAEGGTILVPDTNAFIYSPSLESWSFEAIQKFEIVLVPMVLAELDVMKRDHRNPDVRNKAAAVVRQIKEYRRRGTLAAGVPVVKDRVSVRSIATEPDFEATLSWLDPGIPDDRVLASLIEVMRLHSRSPVVLVTGDVNLQNKAEFAMLPFLEPPDAEA